MGKVVTTDEAAEWRKRVLARAGASGAGVLTDAELEARRREREARLVYGTKSDDAPKT